MTGHRHDPGDFTQDPDLAESDRTLGRTPLYQEEAGVRPGKGSAVTMQPCMACGVPVITGMTDRGDLVPVEPQTVTYALLWLSGEPRPRLKLGRGYPEHRCQGSEEQALIHVPAHGESGGEGA